MPQGVVTHRMPCSFQTHRCNHILLRSKNVRKPWHLSCKATGDRVVDRRDVLLGGAAAVAGLAAHHRGSALATPIQLPDLRNCHPVHNPDTPDHELIDCCPPFSTATEIIDFKLPSAGSPLRVRRAAHHMDGTEYLEKYKQAVKSMKLLPHDDPRSFEQQWRVHCAYCDGLYNQVGYSDLEIQIHNCWLFFPWHRLYLYFYERILGKLIGDDTFALPFWNWDAPEGMRLPSIYADPSSPLYDEKRDSRHAQQPFPLVDFDYSHMAYTEATIDNNSHRQIDNNSHRQIHNNLKIMYRQMISGAKTKELFFGQPYRLGNRVSKTGHGTIECQPHNIVHDWVGDCGHHEGKDMGLLYSAARDPLFFAHHGNIDRMWYIWREKLSCHNTNFTDPDWLNASFLFYDEEKQLVRVCVRDCLDITALCYKYDDVPIPWRDARPVVAERGQPLQLSPGSAGTDLPATLDKTVRVWVEVPRPSKKEKEDEEEEEEEEEVRPPKTEKEEEEEVVLVIDDIEIADHSRYIKFDVFVNEPQGGADTAAAQCAGSMALLPHAIRQGEDKDSMKTTAWFGISDLLEFIGANGDDKINVSIVPRSAGDQVTVGSVRIEYVK